ncbi:MAG: virulence protein E [Prevotellaceae bacterium]|nr:virulence protein E [Candidatus Minthosoma caballi]
MLPQISIFNPGYINSKGRAVMQTRPYQQTVSLTQVYKYIVGDYAKKETIALRQEQNEDKQKELKLLTLRYCTPFGTFSYRDNNHLIQPSGMMVVDIDHIDDHQQLLALRQALIHDRRFETELLFVSPRGSGLKWFINIGDMKGMQLRDFFRLVARHVQFEYGVQIDESGKDPSRACYLCHDLECYINPKYLTSSLS